MKKRHAEAVGFTRAQLEAARDTTVADLLGPNVRLLFVGINPGLWTAAAQAHFARRGNRFYPALFAGGVVDRLIDASAGYSADDLAHLVERGIGITNLVARPTARADEIRVAELVEGAGRLDRLVGQVAPAVAAILGVTAYRQAFGLPKATIGPQPDRWPATRLWVAPNPSGLNAHSSLTDLARAYRAAAIAAGIDVYDL